MGDKDDKARTPAEQIAFSSPSTGTCPPDVSITQLGPMRKTVTEDQVQKNGMTMMKDCHEQIEVLIEAIDVLAKLAAMGSSDYANRQRAILAKQNDDGECKEAKDEHETGFSGEQVDPWELQHRLDDLQSKWKLEETPVPDLAQSIHRLQSQLVQQAVDYDHSALRCTELEKKLTSVSERNHKVEGALKKSLQRNKLLKEKLRKKMDERKSLVKSFRSYVGKIKAHKKKEDNLSIEEKQVAHQLRAHERLVLIEHKKKMTMQREEKNSAPQPGNRSRCSSQASADSFSDIEACLEDDIFRSYNDEDKGDDSESDQSSTVGSVSTVTSMITDEGLATIRFSGTDLSLETGNYDKDTGNNEINESNEVPDLNDIRSPTRSFFSFGRDKPTTYHLSFPKGNVSTIGLQFSETLLDVEESTPRKRTFSGSSNVLKRVMRDKSADENAPRRRANSTSGLGYDGGFEGDNDSVSQMLEPPALSIEDSIQTSRNRTHSASELTRSDFSHEPPHQTRAFCVSGTMGFDTDRNSKPTLGARLIAVNGKSIEDKTYTLEHLKSLIDECMRSLSDGSEMTLSFREENMPKDPLMTSNINRGQSTSGSTFDIARKIFAPLAPTKEDRAAEGETANQDQQKKSEEETTSNKRISVHFGSFLRRDVRENDNTSIAKEESQSEAIINKKDDIPDETKKSTTEECPSEEPESSTEKPLAGRAPSSKEDTSSSIKMSMNFGSFFRAENKEQRGSLKELEEGNSTTKVDLEGTENDQRAQEDASSLADPASPSKRASIRFPSFLRREEGGGGTGGSQPKQDGTSNPNSEVTAPGRKTTMSLGSVGFGLTLRREKKGEDVIPSGVDGDRVMEGSAAEALLNKDEEQGSTAPAPSEQPPDRKTMPFGQLLCREPPKKDEILDQDELNMI